MKRSICFRRWQSNYWIPKPETSEVDQLPDPHLGLDFFTIKLSDQDHILAIEQQLTAKIKSSLLTRKSNCHCV